MARHFLRSLVYSNIGFGKHSAVRSQSNQTCDFSHEMASDLTGLTQPQTPLHHYVLQHHSKWHNRVAIECGVTGKKYTFGDLSEKCKRLSGSLGRLGLKQGDTIGICLPNVPEFPVAYLGSSQAGLIVLLISTQCTLDEFSRQMKENDVNYLICHPSNLNTIKQVKTVLKKNVKIICTHGVNGKSPGCNEGVVSFEDLLSCSTTDSPRTQDQADESATALKLYTSGVTGRPKGVRLSHKSLTSNLEQITRFAKLVETHGDHQDVSPATIPFHHSLGQALLMYNLRVGAKVITTPEFELNSFLKITNESENIVVFLFPYLLNSIMHSEAVKTKHLNGIREIVIGGASFHTNNLDKIRKKTRATISQIYGLTEMSAVVTWTQEEEDNLAPLSTGNLAAGTLCKVVCPKSNDIRPPHQTGEICLKGPQMMDCYINDPEGTEKVIDSEGWLHTKDVGYLDELGCLRAINRSDDYIQINGYEVRLANLETVIRSFPGVSDAAVLGAPEAMGATPVAFVQTQRGINASEEEIMGYVSRRIYKHKHLMSVKFVDHIPKSTSGNIIRQALRKML